MNPLYFSILALGLTGCGGCLGARETSAAGTSSVGIRPSSAELRDGACDPQALEEVGATWVYPGVTCPVAPDTLLIAACVDGGWAALIDGQGYATLGEAVAAAQPSETVVICPGLHPDVFTARDLTLAAADPTPDATVLDGGADYWVVLEDSTLRGVTLGPERGVEVERDASGVFECITVHDHTNPKERVIYGAGGGGTITVRNSTFSRAETMVLGASSYLVVEDSAFLDNTPNEETGEVVVSAQGLTMRRTAFIGNRQDGIGETCISVDPGPNAIPSLIEDSLFEGNVNAGVGAPGIVTVRAELTVRNTTFRENSSARGVACIRHVDDGTTLEVEDSTFVENTSATGSAEFGGIIDGNGRVTIVRSRFEDNATVLGTRSSVFWVGDVLWSGTDMVVRRNVGGQAALWVSYADHVTCVCCDFGSGGDDNQPADGYLTNHEEAELPLNFTL